MNSIKTTHSEISPSKKEKKSPKHKLLTSVFRKKSNHSSGNIDKTQTDHSLAICHHKTNDDVIEENKHLTTKLEELELLFEAKERDILELSWQLKKQETKVSRAGDSSDGFQQIQNERNSLRKCLQKSENEAESLRIEIAFLQEDKAETTAKLKQLSKEHKDLQEKCENLDTNLHTFKEKYVNQMARAEAALREVCDEICDLIEQNRLLIQNGLKGKPDDFKRIMRVTQEYLKLDAEKNRYRKQMGKLVTRVVVQDVFINDLVLELRSVSGILQKAGIEYSCDKLLKQYQEMNIPRSELLEDIDNSGICRCTDSGCGKEKKDHSCSATITTKAQVHAPFHRSPNNSEKRTKTRSKTEPTKEGRGTKTESKRSEKGRTKMLENTGSDRADEPFKDEKINIPLHVASQLKRSPRKRMTKYQTTEL